VKSSVCFMVNTCAIALLGDGCKAMYNVECNWLID
jgi:hypothetical protein